MTFEQEKMEDMEEDGVPTMFGEPIFIEGGEGLGKKEFYRVLDKYLWGDGTMLSDEFAAMSQTQQEIVHIIRRSRARNKTK